MDPHDLPRAPGDVAAAPVTDPVADPVIDPVIDPDPAPSLVLPAVDGLHPLGSATIDSDADGVLDTTFGPVPGTPPEQHLLLLATDLDHDGDADVLTTLSPDGSVCTTGPPGPPAGDPVPPTGWDPGWDAGWDAPAPPAATLDPATGAWTRSP